MTKNLWPDRFDVQPQESPRAILAAQASTLTEFTAGKLAAQVSPNPAGDGGLFGRPMSGAWGGPAEVSNKLRFRFEIVAPLVQNYRFTILRFAHDATGYPVEVEIDDDIAGELGIEGGKTVAQSAAVFEELLGRILQSQRMRLVIGSLLQMSAE